MNLFFVRNLHLLLCATFCHLQRIEVKLKQGTFIGTRSTTVFDNKLYFAFYGIPYAQPPTKKLRFTDPKPVKKSKHLFDATEEYRGACAQAHIVHKHALFGIEDCLVMNIYTPQLPNKDATNLKSVIVWFHGYAFTSSFSHIYGPDLLIDNDVVFVSVTYRIGVFGFLKLNASDTNANMGLKDIVMCLKWINKNIKRFGGNNKQVTVMGSGSGANYLALLATTKEKKWFSKMILQSGSMYSASIFQGDYNLERNNLKDAMRKKGFKKLKKASAKDIIGASHKLYNSIDLMNFQRPVVPFTPILEIESHRSVLVMSPEDIYSNDLHRKIDIPMIIGFNTQESISEVIPFLHNPNLIKSFHGLFKFMVPFSNGCSYKYSSKIYKDVSDKIKSFYFKDGISEKSIEALLKYTSELIKYPIYRFIKEQITFNSKVFVYKFNYLGNFNAVKANSIAGLNIKIKGAATGDEICYILTCEPFGAKYVNLNNDTNKQERIFIRELSKMWANFAKYGDPSISEVSNPVTWPPMNVRNPKIMLIGNERKLIGTHSEETMMKFWDNLFETYYSEEMCRHQTRDEL